ncbi:hypothetical protein HMPREF3218_0202153 [Prevotella bivia]|nr:hypothetical protein HMPREF3218_0202153 [Prevotella bivia]
MHYAALSVLNLQKALQSYCFFRKYSNLLVKNIENSTFYLCIRGKFPTFALIKY